MPWLAWTVAGSDTVCDNQVDTVASRTGSNTSRRTSHRRRLAEVVQRMRHRLASCAADISDVHVPVYVSLLLLAGYVLLGALLFGLWEPEWGVLVGSYFCFVTLSTIGFGDVVPGTSLDAWSSTPKLVLCSLYVVCGLALLAMCFDLMQDQVIQVCRDVTHVIQVCRDVIQVIKVCRDVASRLGLAKQCDLEAPVSVDLDDVT